jgi:hypothetical protein
MLTRQQAKVKLKSKGWSYRSAAPLLGVHYCHLCRVLTGKRESRRLLLAIDALPPRKMKEAA